MMCVCVCVCVKKKKKKKKKGIVAGQKQPLHWELCGARPGSSTVVVNSISFAT